jgi:arabinofuranosyltransferase
VGAIIFAILFLAVVVGRAWVSDDSYITFRVVNNFHAGYGFRWNVAERVQVFTHPLWMLLITFIFTFSKEVYLTSIFLSIVLSILVLGVFIWHERKNRAIWLGILLLALSNAYVDYSTSGLENALSHFLLIVYLVLFSRSFQSEKLRDIFWLGFLGGLACLTRLDHLLIYLPSFVFMIINNKKPWKAFMSICLGFLPVAAWLIFSTIYYGFPLPNTFYAKVGNWLPRSVLFNQGWKYVQHTLENDLITGLTIFLGIILSGIHYQKERMIITLGAIAYLLYVIWIGGDFMEGRFFTTIFLLFVFQILHYDFPEIKIHHYAWIAPLLIVVSLFARIPTLLFSDEGYIESWEDGIVNERFFYAKETALLRNGKFNLTPAHPWMYEGDVMRRACVAQNNCHFAQNSVGFSGYYAGPDVFILDRYGLASALMARIPPEITPEWRIGHFLRKVPSGYLDYLSSGNITKVKDVQIHELITDLEVITTEKVFSWNRINMIIKFWTRANHLPINDQ